MGHLQILPGAPNAGAGPAASLWPQSAPRPATPPPHMDSQLGMGTLGHHDVLSSLGLKLPSSTSSSLAASYYSDQLHAVVSNAGRPQAYDASSSLPCTTAVTSLSAALSSVSAAPPIINNTVGMDLPPVSLAAPEMQYWNGPAAMSVAWPDLPTPNGAFP
uniref:Dof-type domain-containing protein n=2 Tax=Oryza brachyantha TaxID=4533 RepID=J3LT49_ORYBR